MQKAWPYFRMFAHRGGGILGPENTMMGMQTGLSYGYHAMEVDAMLSKDGGIVLMHDEKFGRPSFPCCRSTSAVPPKIG